MRIVLLSALGLVALLLTTSPATAVLIGYDSISAPDAPWIDASQTPYYRFGGSTSYDAAADILTFTHLPSSNLWESSSFFMIAGVDGTGELLGGVALWLGGSASLGVPPGSILLKGDVIAVEYGFDGAPDSGAPAIDFVIHVEESLPALGLGPFVGYFNAIIPWALHVPGEPPEKPEPWSTSFTVDYPWTADALFNVVRVPLAPTLVLFVAGIGVCLGLRRMRVRSRGSTPAANV